MSDITAHLPGKLGNPDAVPATDGRTDPRLVAVIAEVGEIAPGVATVGPDASHEECLAYCAAFEAAAGRANPELLANLPVVDSVTSITEAIPGVDGNEIQLFVHRPKQGSGPIPCVVHIHGGGMVLMSATDPGPIRWRNSLAEMGMVVVGVEFRNGGGRLGNHPFPAGLNDCASAVQWTYANRERLGISSIVVSGESGGGNLSLATTLKANREGWVNQIDGVYAMCPYISGLYANPPAHLLSLHENDDYTLNGPMMAALARVYDPSGDNRSNPLAWPYHAASGDLAGLPPHVISVNELDPLRDEGLVYFRKLLAAGVPALGRTVHGTTHAGDQAFPDILPDVYQDSLRAIYGFATSLSRE